MPDTTKFGYPACLPAPGSTVMTTATSGAPAVVGGVTFGASDPAFHLDAVWAAGDHLELVSVDRNLGALTTTKQRLTLPGSLTRAGPQHGLTDPRIGTYSQDGSGALWSVFKTEESRLGFWNHDDVVIPLEDRNGDPCADSDFDPVAEVVIPTDPPILPTLSLASDARDVEVCLEDENGMRAEWYWSHFASSEEFLVLPKDNRWCDAGTDGIRIAKVGGVVCEP